MIETWRDIPGWEGLYQASDMGRVRSFDRHVPAKDASQALRRGRILIPVQKQGRYLAVTLADGRRRKQYLLHELVLLAFVGPRPSGQCGCHFDDDKANNVLANLRYDTPHGNAQDQIRNGRSNKGEQHPAAALTAEEVRDIRASAASGVSLALRYGVTPGHISSIRKRKTWRHI